MGYYFVKKEDDTFLVNAFLVIGVIGGILLCIQRLVEAITPPLVSLGNWMISFHFSNFCECVLHFYTWLVIVPIVAVFIIGLGSMLACIGGGIWGGYKLTSLMDFGSDWVAWLLYIVIGFFLCIGGMILGASIGGYVILGPALALISIFWHCIIFIKNKVFHMTWLNDALFGILLYGIIPGGLLTGFLLTK